MITIRFQNLLGDEQLADVPILMLGNKIDADGAIGEDQIRQYFGLFGLSTGKVGYMLPSVLSCKQVAVVFFTHFYSPCKICSDSQRDPVLFNRN